MCGISRKRDGDSRGQGTARPPIGVIETNSTDAFVGAGLPAIPSALIAGKPAPTGTRRVRRYEQRPAPDWRGMLQVGAGQGGELQQVGLRTLTGCWRLAKHYLSPLQINLHGDKKTFFCHVNWSNKKARPPKPADRWRPLALTLLATFWPRPEKSRRSLSGAAPPLVLRRLATTRR